MHSHQGEMQRSHRNRKRRKTLAAVAVAVVVVAVEGSAAAKYDHIDTTSRSIIAISGRLVMFLLIQHRKLRKQLRKAR